MHFESIIGPTWSAWLEKFEGCDRVNIEILFEAVIDQVWRCTWRTLSSQFGDTLGGKNLMNSEMHVKADRELEIHMEAEI